MPGASRCLLSPCPVTPEDQQSLALLRAFRDVTEGIWELREAGPPDAGRRSSAGRGAASARCYDALVGHRR